MKIVWDEPKRLATLSRRQLDFAIVTPAFFESAKVRAAKGGRFLALGLIAGRPYAVVFKPLGTEAISLIRLRPASAKEEAHSMTGRAADKAPLTEAEIAERDAARGLTDADLSEVIDNPEWTDEELRDAKPFSDVFPEMAAEIRRSRTSSKA